MFMESCVEIISTVGFPIACVIAMGFFIKGVYDMMVTKSADREEKLYQVITDAQALNCKLSENNEQFAEVLRAYKADLEVIRADVSDIKDYFRSERNKE